MSLKVKKMHQDKDVSWFLGSLPAGRHESSSGNVTQICSFHLCSWQVEGQCVLFQKTSPALLDLESLPPSASQVFLHEWCSQDRAKKTFLFIKRAKAAFLCCRGPLAGQPSCGGQFVLHCRLKLSFFMIKDFVQCPTPTLPHALGALVATFPSPFCDNSFLAIFPP